MGNKFSFNDLKNNVYECVTTELDEPEIKKENNIKNVKNKIALRAINPNISYESEKKKLNNQMKRLTKNSRIKQFRMKNYFI